MFYREIPSLNLTEFSNSTKLYPHYAAHESYVTDISPPNCQIVTTLDYGERCEFVKRTESCEGHGKISYIDVFFCMINPLSIASEIAGIAMFVIICGYLFFLSGTITDKFFCPSLKILSNLLRMSESLAGVTLLAFGNSAADFLTCLTSLDGEVGLLFSELTGAANFVTGLVAGVIIYINPFALVGSLFARDCGFLLLAIISIDYCLLTDGGVTLTESIVILLLYLLYIIVVFVDQILISYTKKRYIEKVRMSIVPSEILLDKLQQVRMQGELEVISRTTGRSITQYLNLGSTFVSQGPNTNLFKQFAKSINPIDLDEWKNGNIIEKVIVIIKIPGLFFLLLVIPIVDYELNLHGWSKLLNSMQIFILPTVCFYLSVDSTQYGKILGYPVVLWIGAVTIPFGILVFFTSRTDRPPAYHNMFAILSIVAAIDFIYVVASEIVGILSLFGVVLKASPSFLGCTVLAWGNSVGDLIANISLAKQGYQKMAFAACFGGPLFNIIMGFGVIFLYKALKDERGMAIISQGSLGLTCAVFLMIGLTASWGALTVTNYYARRSVGIFMVSIYCIFFAYACLTFVEVIHPYGTDHREDTT